MCQHYLHKADFSLTETLFKQKTFAIRKNKMDLLIRANKDLLEIWIICKKRPTGWQSSVGGLLFYVFMNMVVGATGSGFHTPISSARYEIQRTPTTSLHIDIFVIDHFQNFAERLTLSLRQFYPDANICDKLMNRLCAIRKFGMVIVRSKT